MQPRILSDVLTYHAQEFPEKMALEYRDTVYSYADFKHRVDRLATGLIDLGIQVGDRMVIQMKNQMEYLDLFMAAAKVGALLIGINYNFKPAEIRAILEDSRPKVAICGDDFADEFEKVGADLKYHYCISPKNDRWRALSSLYVEPDSKRLLQREQQVDPEGPVFVIYTSGSTGKPKGVMLSHGNIIRNITVHNRHFGVTAHDKVILQLPMNHVGGATETFFSIMLAGGSAIVAESFHPVKTLEFIQEKKVTLCLGVPTMYIMMFSLPNFSDYDLKSLRGCLVAGAPTPTEVMKKMTKMAPVVQTGYGMTEVGGFITFSSPNDPPEVVSLTVGKVAPDYELAIVDDTGREVPQGEIGEVWFRGSCLMIGYLSNPEETRKAVNEDGWYATGDMGRIDEYGNLVLSGRKKDMYIRGGYNVYPAEVEDVLASHPSVKMCAVIGVADDKYGETGKAFVVLRDGGAISDTELRQYIGERLAGYKVPTYIEFRDSLPLTPLGKMDKKLLA